MKKVLSVLITLVLVVTIIPLGGISTSALQSGDYTYIISNNSATITAYSGPGGVITIPSTLGGYPVKALDDFVFDGCTNLTDVTISNGINSIGELAFDGNTGLKRVSLPDSLLNISGGAFRNCGLTSVTIPFNVVNIGLAAFWNCTSLSGITVAPNNNYYCSVDGVLFNKSKTDLIQYPLAKTGSYAVPSEVVTIGDYSFEGAAGLTSITMSNGVRVIGTGALCRTGLTGLNLPNGVASIGDSAFWACTELTTVTLPESVTTIYGNAFSSCEKLINVTLPNNIKKIENTTFQACTSLTSITIPKSVTSIDSYAFDGCSSLTSAYFMGKAPTSVGDSIFGGCAPNFKVYFLSDNYSAGWNGFVTDIFVPTPTGLKATNITDTTIDLSWAASESATEYLIFNGTEIVYTPDRLITTAYTVTGLQPNTTYHFTVMALNKHADSPHSAVLTVTTKDTENLPGDINDDAEVNLKDVTTLSRYVAGWTGLEFNPDALDVNGDGEVDLIDITLLSRYVAGWDVVIH